MNKRSKTMNRWLTRLGVAAGMALGALVIAPAEARATSGYPCTVAFYPNTGAPGAGNFGTVEIEMWTGPQCTGTFLGFFDALSTGATGAGVVTLSTYREAALLELYRNA